MGSSIPKSFAVEDVFRQKSRCALISTDVVGTKVTELPFFLPKSGYAQQIQSQRLRNQQKWLKFIKILVHLLYQLKCFSIKSAWIFKFDPLLYSNKADFRACDYEVAPD